MSDFSKYISGCSTILLIGLSIILSACEANNNAVDNFADVNTTRISQTSPGAEWLSYGGGYNEQRHSPLSRINQKNIGELGVAWTYELATNRGVESTPIIVDGVMYVTSAWSMVYALDAKTGEEIWVYDPEVDRSVGVSACCDVVNRGVAVYDGNIYVGVIDGRLEALNAKTGERIWSVVTVDQSQPYTITGAPRAANGKIFIGNGGAELGVRGYISAYDHASGELVWRFYTAPNPNKEPDGAASDSAFAEFANDSWGDTGVWKTDGGGGTVWDSIVYDEVTNRVIFGVGNASPWNWKIRDPSGKDNLFVSSIVAVDADSGEYAWHYQTTPGDTWDYTATQSIILADLPIGKDNEMRHVVMQAPKNGFFYVLDANTGEFISAAGFVPQNWTTGLDESGRPIVEPLARDQSNIFLQTPGPLGAHNWHPMAFNPDTGLAYIPAQEIPQAYIEDTNLPGKPTKWNTGLDFSAGIPPKIPPGILPAIKSTLKGRLLAWDPVNQEPRWSVEHNNAWNGGVLSTESGLVFQGRLDGNFVAYNAANGDELWRANLKSGAASGPGTYEIDGEQYITITTGWGTAFALVNGFVFEDTDAKTAVGKVVTFKLGGTAEISDPNFIQIDKTPKAPAFGDIRTLQEGAKHYARNCMVCHGVFGISSGVLVDLRWSSITGNADAWNAVLMDGTLSTNGMVSFSDVLSVEDSEAIRAYVLTQAHDAS